jgi:hypothetical protein
LAPKQELASIAKVVILGWIRLINSLDAQFAIIRQISRFSSNQELASIAKTAILG